MYVTYVMSSGSEYTESSLSSPVGFWLSSTNFPFLPLFLLEFPQKLGILNGRTYVFKKWSYMRIQSAHIRIYAHMRLHYLHMRKVRGTLLIIPRLPMTRPKPLSLKWFSLYYRSKNSTMLDQVKKTRR